MDYNVMVYITVSLFHILHRLRSFKIKFQICVRVLFAFFVCYTIKS